MSTTDQDPVDIDKVDPHPVGPKGATAIESLILQTVTRLLLPLILLLALFVFNRGHNEPGGGFIGGLLAAIAFALYEKAQGLEAARRALRFRPLSIAATGLGCTLAGGLWGAMQYGYFLKGVWPLIEKLPDGSKSGLPLGSIMLFDFGVFLVVLGGVCGILFTLEEVVGNEMDSKED
ncbi:MnhB domain-containing protein [Amaricoccus macauensis]|uniref:MnhB domain-containing protein n=1 Tax=Amaricoccus macauensis TaxID=57001 RepID=UPI003C79BCE6